MPFHQVLDEGHAALCSSLRLCDIAASKIYAAMLLERLIFLYFLQQRELLDNNPRYLQDRLRLCQERDIPFFAFLGHLFRHCSGKVLSAPWSELIGCVPMLHPALFAEHPLDDAAIPDAPFIRLLHHFARYHWPLADRKDGNEMADAALYPDVLEYSFERYINRKELGAYYTAEDITTYISRHTLYTHILEELPAACVDAIYDLLSTRPEQYLPASLICTERLPGESASEQQARQTRWHEIAARLRARQFSYPYDFITYNLNGSLCLLDLLSTYPESALPRALYESISRVSILDPTIGSGAFLFSLLALLEPLYTACLARMQHMLGDPGNGCHCSPDDLAFFQETLERVFPNRAFFVLKSIVSHNLYGVDIMSEASEICKLRLLLRLVGSLEKGDDPVWLARTPLHVYTGNALIGSLTLCQEAKPDQQHILDAELAGQFGVDSADGTAFREWRASHSPFHWSLAFAPIIERGGFDIIIGNPPYIEYSKVRQDYRVPGYEGASCGNLYAAFVERSLQLSRARSGYLGLIVPLSICSGERFERLRSTIRQGVSHLWLANFDIFPCRLFAGAYQRLSILFARRAVQPAACVTHVTAIRRWYARERPHLIDLTPYTPTCCSIRPGFFPKLASSVQETIQCKIMQRAGDDCIADILNVYPTPHFIYYQEATNYWLKATCRIPFYRKNGVVMPPAHGRFLYFASEQEAYTIMALMNSSLFYSWFAAFSDGFHLSHKLVKTFPISSDIDAQPDLSRLARLLEVDIQRNVSLCTRNTSPAANRGHRIELEEYRLGLSKPLLDAIDRVLAEYYALTEQELDFILHYDVKYRMGQEKDGDGGAYAAR